MSTDQQPTNRYPTWRSIEKNLKRRDRAPWVEAAVCLAVIVVVSAGLVIGMDLHRDHVDRKRAEYEALVEGPVEARFNREYDEKVQLEVLTKSAGRFGTYQRTYVTLDGVFRPDCVLWKTEKDDPDTWTIECSKDPQPQ